MRMDTIRIVLIVLVLIIVFNVHPDDRETEGGAGGIEEAESGAPETEGGTAE